MQSVTVLNHCVIGDGGIEFAEVQRHMPVLHPATGRCGRSASLNHQLIIMANNWPHWSELIYRLKPVPALRQSRLSLFNLNDGREIKTSFEKLIAI